MSSSGKSSWGFLKGFLLVLVTLPGALLFLGFLSLRPFTIPSASMMPNLQIGYYMFADRFRTPLHGAIARGDVVTLDFKGTTYVERIVGMPGDTVQMRDGRLIINETPVDLQETDERTTVQDREATEQIETLPSGKSYRILDMGVTQADNTRVWTVPEGHYFAMGDNRDNSADSRYNLGFVPETNISGKVRFVLFNTEGKSIFGRVF